MSKPRFDRVGRDRRKSYNPMTVADLQKLTPLIEWNTFTKIGLKNVDSVNRVTTQIHDYFRVGFKENSVDWKAYMRWSLLNRASSQLSTTIENANFEFYGKT
jgi:endothelin-converting enzyme/putative endopeptidase